MHASPHHNIVASLNDVVRIVVFLPFVPAVNRLEEKERETRKENDKMQEKYSQVQSSVQ